MGDRGRKIFFWLGEREIWIKGVPGDIVIVKEQGNMDKTEGQGDIVMVGGQGDIVRGGRVEW